jgi:hypothetical protein
MLAAKAEAEALLRSEIERLAEEAEGLRGLAGAAPSIDPVCPGDPHQRHPKPRDGPAAPSLWEPWGLLVLTQTSPASGLL